LSFGIVPTVVFLGFSICHHIYYEEFGGNQTYKKYEELEEAFAKQV
jgi:hypothetical protein